MSDEDLENYEEKVMQKSRLEYLPMGLIKQSEVALRGVDRRDEKFLQLSQSVANNGVLEPILVREIEVVEGENSDAVTFYGLVNGLQRFTAAKDAGLAEIPAHIVDLDAGELMQAQIITNMHRVETKPAQYSMQLLRLISSNPLLTMQDLAKELSTSVKWLNDRLSLNKLHEDIQKLVDDDELKLANAYALAKLPTEEQKEYLDRALADKSTEFSAVVAQRAKEIKDARREGREPKPQVFVAIERSRGLIDLKQERATLENIKLVIQKANATSAVDGARAALDWVLNMDSDSVKIQEDKYNQKKKERKEAQERAKIERDKRTADAAAAKQADLMAL